MGGGLGSNHPRFFISAVTKVDKQITLTLIIVWGNRGVWVRLPLSPLQARSQELVCRNCWAYSDPDVYLAWRPRVMKPGPVAEHLGRPPSRVPVCSDSGPLWSEGMGLKAEPPETLPSPCL